MSLKRKTTWYAGLSSKHDPIDDSNVGHKMLEKMGWSKGLGLGKDNQGSTESVNYRHKVCRTGFRSRDEICNETLPHQSAFDNLLGELSSTVEEKECREKVDSSPAHILRTHKKQIRYSKMARAKDVTNYAKKDLEGILGKELTLDGEYNKCINSEVKEVTAVCENSSAKRFKDDVIQDNHLQNKEPYKTANGNSGHFDDGSENISYTDKGEEKKRKKKKKLKNSQLESNFLDYSETETMSATKTEDRIEISPLPNALDSSPEKEDDELPMKSNTNKKKHKREYLENTDSKTNSAKPVNIPNEKNASKQNEIWQGDFEKKQKVEKDIVKTSGIFTGFVGSNLHKIKGYGNW